MVFLTPHAFSQGQQAPSDAIILIAPSGNNTTLLSVIMDKVISHNQLQDRLQEILRQTGWRLLSMDIRDDVITSQSGYRPMKQTSASLILNDAILKKEGGYWLQPFVNAFADLNVFEVIYMDKEDASFQGLRDFTNPSLKIKLIQAGSPYRYKVYILNHSKPIPVLPFTQAQQDAHIIAAHRLSVFMAIAPWVFLAAMVGLIIVLGYFLIQRRTHNINDLK
jgi:hypothetical protein